MATVKALAPAGANAGAAPIRRGPITVTVMLATVMQALDMTIANVALPHMQGSMSATLEQISWVLTSYVVAAAICMPLTGVLAARLGRRRLFMISIVAFTVTSMLCGLAQNLEQIVVFRILQGAFGAFLVPLSQSVLLDVYPPARHGWAMAVWGVGVMLGPIGGPSLGGILTEWYDWRWVFFINLPFGMLALLGMVLFLPESELDRSRRFDLFGFALLALAIGSLQMMLDRGQSLDWFSSGEIIAEAILSAACFYLFIAHITTSAHPFIDPALFRDRNFAVGLMLIFVVGVILLATMALLPPFLQNLMGYPVIDTGGLLAARGVGTMIAMITVGRLASRIDLRPLVVVGFLLSAIAMWDATHFTDEIGGWPIVRSGLVQGLGLGFLFVPLSTITFATLTQRFRNDGTSIFSLVRSIGSSIGVSIVIGYLARATQVNHAALAESVSPFRPALQAAIETGTIVIDDPAGLAQLNGMVNHQAVLMAYLQDFRLLMMASLLPIPLVLLLRKAAPRR
ncbi:MAG: DHA2 family efflux MFS transporter permease subunit [Burkholderiaceae bacterium]